MSGTLSIAAQDVRLAYRDRAGLLWMFVLPIVFATFFGLVMGGGGSPGDAKATLTIDDRDRGALAQLVLHELAGERLATRPLAELAPDESPVRTLVIPEGFTRDALAGEPVTLKLVKEPDTNLQAALLAQARILGAVTRVLGRVVTASDGRDTVTEADVLAVAPPEPLVTLESRFAGTQAAPPSGFAQSVPGTTTMFVLLVTLTYGAASISEDRQRGMLRRLLTAPVLPAQVVWGKILGRYLLAGSQIVVLVVFAVVARGVWSIDIGVPPLTMLLVLMVYAAAVAPLGVLYGAWFRDPDRASSLGVITTMAMAALGGCWWPLEVVPPIFQKVALVFPTGWVMSALTRVGAFGDPLSAVGSHLVVLVGFSVVFSMIAARALRIE